MISIEKPGSPEEVLEHFGKKGMKWGVRNEERLSSSGKPYNSNRPTSSKLVNRSINAHYARSTARTQKRKAQGKTGPKPVAKTIKGLGKAAKTVNRKLGDAVFEFEAVNTGGITQRKIAEEASKSFANKLPGIKAKHGAYGKLRNRAKNPFSPEAKAYRADCRKTYLRALEKSANSRTNSSGTKRYTLKEDGKPNTTQYFWKLSTEQIKHAANETFTVRPIFDDEGWIVDIEFIDDTVAQTMDLGANFLIHMGIEI